MDPREGEKEKSDVEGNDDNFRGEKTLSNARGLKDHGIVTVLATRAVRAASLLATVGRIVL